MNAQHEPCTQAVIDERPSLYSLARAALKLSIGLIRFAFAAPRFDGCYVH